MELPGLRAAALLTVLTAASEARVAWKVTVMPSACWAAVRERAKFTSLPYRVASKSKVATSGAAGSSRGAAAAASRAVSRASACARRSEVRTSPVPVHTSAAAKSKAAAADSPWASRRF